MNSFYLRPGAFSRRSRVAPVSSAAFLLAETSAAAMPDETYESKVPSERDGKASRGRSSKLPAGTNS